MSIASKLNYLKGTKDLMKTGLNTMGAGITNDTFRSYKDKIQYVYDNWPRVTGEGTDLSLSPTIKAPMSVGYKGDTSQYSPGAGGKNLFNYNGTHYVDSCVLTINDGELKLDQLSADFNGQAWWGIDVSHYTGNVTISYGDMAGYPAVGDERYLAYCFMNSIPTTWSNMGTLTVVDKTNKYSTASLGSGNYLILVLQAQHGNAHVDGWVTIDEVQVELGSSPTSYEPYIDGSVPTPTTPVPINVVSGRQDVQVCGKNLFNPNNFNLGTSNGITSTVEDDHLVLNGTASSTAYVNFTASGFNGSCAWGIKSDVALGNLQIKRTGAGVVNITPRTTWNKSTLDSTNVTGGWLSIPSGTTLTNCKVYLYVGKGTLSSIDYEAYKGNTYEINLGKNLLPNNSTTQTKSGVTYTVNQDKSITLNGTSTAGFIVEIASGLTLENGTYTLSLKGKIQGCGIYAYAGGNVLKAYVSSSNTPDNWKTNFTLDSTTTFTQIRIDVHANKTFDNVTIYPMIEKGTVATTYAPYKTPIELCKIGNYQDYIYKDNGSWYLHKEIGKVVLNGTQNITLATSGGRRFNATYTALGLTNIKDGTGTYDTAQYRMCDHFRHSSSTYNAQKWGTYYTYKGWLVLYDTDTVISDTNALKTWFTNNPTTIHYVLKTPTTTEITDTELLGQLESIKMSNEDVTYFKVGGDLPTILNVNILKKKGAS